MPASDSSPKRIGDDPEHPKLLRAKAILQKDPARSRKSIEKELRITCHTLRAWVNHGWLRFDYTPDRATNHREHPALKPLQAYLAENPRRYLNALSLKFGVSLSTLRRWEEQGLIKIERIPSKINNTLYWLHDGSNIKAYDPTMVKSKKT